eukprot:2719558-Amphidinium_carterae.1
MKEIAKCKKLETESFEKPKMVSRLALTNCWSPMLEVASSTAPEVSVSSDAPEAVSAKRRALQCA